MNTHGGQRIDDGLIFIPDENDLADAESVNRAYRSLRNSILLGLDALSQAPLRQLAVLSCQDGVNIETAAIPFYLSHRYKTAADPQIFARAFEGPTSLDNTYLDTGAAAFESNTFYYIYLRWDNAANRAKYVISKRAPADNMTHMVNDFSARYLGGFTTDLAGLVLPFHKAGNSYVFLFPLSPAGYSTNETVYTSIDVSGALPPHVRQVRIWYQADTSEAGGSNFTIRTRGITNSHLVVLPPSGHVQGELTLVTDNTQFLQYKVAHNTTNMRLSILGYNE